MPSVPTNKLKLFSYKLKKWNIYQNICDKNFLLKG